MATQIIYRINTGIGPFTAAISPFESPDQYPPDLGVYSFDNLPNQDYTLTVTDSNGCVAVLNTVTTTTTLPPTTTTTTIPPTTTTTTTIACNECTEYGLLYNRYVVEDPREITNIGWHVPTYEEVITLFSYYDPTPAGIYYDVAGELKENGTAHWLTSTNNPNPSELNLRGGGERDGTSGFLGLKEYHNWHCSSSNFGYGDGFYAEDNNQYMWMVYHINEANKRDGWGIRPIKDSTTLSHGQRGTYIGNDGHIYCTICIGTQEWVTEDLIETEYRNHDEIPLYTDQADWTALITGGRTAYNNDGTNIGCGEIVTTTTTTTTTS